MHIARNSRLGPVSISRMVREEGLPIDYIEQLLMKLRRHKIIKSVRGVKGGYFLEKEPARISIKDVLEAVEGDAFEVICMRRRNLRAKECMGSTGCALKNVWIDLKEHIEDYLEKQTIESLLKKSKG